MIKAKFIYAKDRKVEKEEYTSYLLTREKAVEEFLKVIASLEEQGYYIISASISEVLEEYSTSYANFKKKV